MKLIYEALAKVSNVHPLQAPVKEEKHTPTPLSRGDNYQPSPLMVRVGVKWTFAIASVFT